VADEQLAKVERERTNSHDEQAPGPASPSLRRGRSRSISSRSSDSISTISTNRSSPRSRSRPTRKEHSQDDYVMSQRERPDFSRSPSRHRKRKYQSSSANSSSVSSSEPRSRDRKARRHRTLSPDDRGRPSSFRRGSHRSKSRSLSLDKSRIARERKSTNEGNKPGYSRIPEQRGRPSENQSDRRGTRSSQQPTNTSSNHKRDPPVRQERSLSPYSRRLALTQSMNMPR